MFLKRNAYGAGVGNIGCFRPFKVGENIEQVWRKGGAVMSLGCLIKAHRLRF